MLCFDFVRWMRVISFVAVWSLDDADFLRRLQTRVDAPDSFLSAGRVESEQVLSDNSFLGVERMLLYSTETHSYSETEPCNV